MKIASAMLEITSGSTPCRIIGSTTTFLKSTPSTSSETTRPTSIATGNDAWPNFIAARTKNAGSMTNSPCAKLIVCDVCQTSTKPIATSA